MSTKQIDILRMEIARAIDRAEAATGDERAKLLGEVEDLRQQMRIVQHMEAEA